MKVRPEGPNTRSQPVLRPLCVALMIALAAPALVLAQDDDDFFGLDEPTLTPSDPALIAELTEIRNYVEIGAMYVSDDSFRFGRYTGLKEEGGYGVLNIDWFQRGAYDAADAGWWRIVGRDLGLRSRSVALEGGHQGSYRLRLDYDQIPSFRSDSAATIFRGAGSDRLTLPSGWVAGANTAGMPLLLPSLEPVEFYQERQRVGVGFDRRLSQRWDFTSSARHERKDGLKSIGAVIGNSGGNPRAVVIPEPVDYETREFEFAARYTDRKAQFQARYYVSLFDNANAGLTWQNPYAAIGGWGPGVGHPTGFGRIAMPPDNRFHQASVAGAYNLSERTRLSADVAMGRMSQNDAFLPFTINPELAASITQPLPRSSLNGRIDTTSVNLRATSRTSDRFNWTANYRYDDRDNRTPRNEYVYIGGDSQNQDTGETSSRRRFNEPASYREHRLRFDAGYRLADRTRLTGNLERREIDRTHSERERARETSVGAALTHQFSDGFNAAIRLLHAERSGSTYHGEEPFVSGYAPGYVATVPGGWENAPGLRKPHLADRDRDRISLMANFSPSERWSIGLDASYSHDDYKRSELGLQSARIRAYTVDVSWAPLAQTTLYGFYSYENMDFDQVGASIRGGANRLPDIDDPARRWAVLHSDDIDTGGIGANWTSQDRKWKLGTDYVMALSRGDVDVATGAALSAAPLPTLKTRMHSASVHGDYRFSEQMTLRARFSAEKYRSSDWALDVPANQLANVILLGDDSPNYRLNVITLSLVYQF
jgi:MtrB/PioB family decaheme-associated outer membrane protein